MKKQRCHAIGCLSYGLVSHVTHNRGHWLCVGCVTGRPASDLQTKPSTAFYQSSNVVFQNKWRKRIEHGRLTRIQLANGHGELVEMSCVISSAVQVQFAVCDMHSENTLLVHIHYAGVSVPCIDQLLG